MKNRQVFEIHQALQRLDGAPNGTPGVLIPYRFTGNATYAIAKNISKTSAIVKDVQDTYQRLLKSLLQPGEMGLKKGDPRIEGLTEEYDKVLEIESDYKPHAFPLSGLAINQNAIPPSVLAALDLLITDDTQQSPPEPSAK